MAQVLLAAIVGLVIAWVDSRPNWDDTGITAMGMFTCCALFGAFLPKRPWTWALAIGIWIPLFAIIFHQNYGSLLAIVFAFAGSYAGALLRKAIGSVPAGNRLS